MPKKQVAMGFSFGSKREGSRRKKHYTATARRKGYGDRQLARFMRTVLDKETRFVYPPKNKTR